jgi:hypothetical protein
MGLARKEINPNFYYNDWEDDGFFDNKIGQYYLGDSADDYSGVSTFHSVLTPEEAEYLTSVVGLIPDTNWYIDVTGHVIQTSMFEDTSVFSTSTDTTVSLENLDPYTVLELTTVITINDTNDIFYQLICQVYDHSPLVLDLNRDNRIDTAKNQWLPHAPKFYREYAKYFDMAGSGGALFTEWVAPSSGDGILVKPENGTVDSALQMFGTAGGYTDGYEKLSIVCDQDRNGWVEGPELEGLAIWIDDNTNARCDEGELKSLSSFGVKRISTAHKDYVGRFETGDNQELRVWDWWPSAMEVRKLRR